MSYSINVKNGKPYNYAYASGVYKGLLNEVAYGNIPGIKIEDYEKVRQWLMNKHEQAEKSIFEFSNLDAK